MGKLEWVIAVNYHTMEDYDIPKAVVDRGPDGVRFISAENTVKVRR